MAGQLWVPAYGHGYLFFFTGGFGGELFEVGFGLVVFMLGFEVFDVDEGAGVGICWTSEFVGRSG